jgi:hypothetical protein
MKFLTGIFISAALITTSIARDDGRYADSPLKPWFNQLRDSDGISCCDVADGVRLSDVQWDTKDGHYRVFLDDHWIDVPDRAVILQANRAGVAIVWPIIYDGKVAKIHCFIPGSGT